MKSYILDMTILKCSLYNQVKMLLVLGYMHLEFKGKDEGQTHQLDNCGHADCTQSHGTYILETGSIWGVGEAYCQTLVVLTLGSAIMEKQPA